MAGAPNKETCSTPGCWLPKNHAGDCSGAWRPCPTTGCSLRDGHAGKCNANE